jgi:hypothetical protein
MEYKDIYNGQIFNKIKIVDKNNRITQQKWHHKVLVKCLICEKEFHKTYWTLDTSNKGCQDCVRKDNGRRLGKYRAGKNRLGKFTRNNFITESDTVYIEMIGKYAVGQHSYAVIDLKNLDKVINKGRWFLRKGSTDRKYVTTNLLRINGRAKMLTLHRFLMNLKEGDGLTVDHINGDSMDNRESNLRVCTQAENRSNTKLFRKDGTPKHIRKYFKRINSIEFESYYNIEFFTAIDAKRERHVSKNIPTLKEAMIEYNKMAVEVKGSTARLFNVEEDISD